METESDANIRVIEEDFPIQIGDVSSILALIEKFPYIIGTLHDADDTLREVRLSPFHITISTIVEFNMLHTLLYPIDIGDGMRSHYSRDTFKFDGRKISHPYSKDFVYALRHFQSVHGNINNAYEGNDALHINEIASQRSQTYLNILRICCYFPQSVYSQKVFEVLKDYSQNSHILFAGVMQSLRDILKDKSVSNQTDNSILCILENVEELLKLDNALLSILVSIFKTEYDIKLDKRKPFNAFFRLHNEDGLILPVKFPKRVFSAYDNQGVCVNVYPVTVGEDYKSATPIPIPDSSRELVSPETLPTQLSSFASQHFEWNKDPVAGGILSALNSNENIKQNLIDSIYKALASGENIISKYNAVLRISECMNQGGFSEDQEFDIDDVVLYLRILKFFTGYLADKLEFKDLLIREIDDILSLTTTDDGEDADLALSNAFFIGERIGIRDGNRLYYGSALWVLHNIINSSELRSMVRMAHQERLKGSDNSIEVVRDYSDQIIQHSQEWKSYSEIFERIALFQKASRMLLWYSEELNETVADLDWSRSKNHLKNYAELEKKVSPLLEVILSVQDSIQTLCSEHMEGFDSVINDLHSVGSFIPQFIRINTLCWDVYKNLGDTTIIQFRVHVVAKDVDQLVDTASEIVVVSEKLQKRKAYLAHKLLFDSTDNQEPQRPSLVQLNLGLQQSLMQCAQSTMKAYQQDVLRSLDRIYKEVTGRDVEVQDVGGFDKSLQALGDGFVHAVMPCESADKDRYKMILYFERVLADQGDLELLNEIDFKLLFRRRNGDLNEYITHDQLCINRCDYFDISSNPDIFETIRRKFVESSYDLNILDANEVKYILLVSLEYVKYDLGFIRFKVKQGEKPKREQLISIQNSISRKKIKSLEDIQKWEKFLYNLYNLKKKGRYNSVAHQKVITTSSYRGSYFGAKIDATIEDVSSVNDAYTYKAVAARMEKYLVLQYQRILANVEEVSMVRSVELLLNNLYKNQRTIDAPNLEKLHTDGLFPQINREVIRILNTQTTMDARVDGNLEIDSDEEEIFVLVDLFTSLYFYRLKHILDSIQEEHADEGVVSIFKRQLSLQGNLTESAELFVHLTAMGWRESTNNRLGMDMRMLYERVGNVLRSLEYIQNNIEKVTVSNKNIFYTSLPLIELAYYLKAIEDIDASWDAIASFAPMDEYAFVLLDEVKKSVIRVVCDQMKFQEKDKGLFYDRVELCMKKIIHHINELQDETVSVFDIKYDKFEEICILFSEQEVLTTFNVLGQLLVCSVLE